MWQSFAGSVRKTILTHPWFQRVTTFACHKNDRKQFPGYKPLQWCTAICVSSPALTTSFYVNLSLEPILAQVYEWTKCSIEDSKFLHLHTQHPLIFFFNKIQNSELIQLCCSSWYKKKINQAGVYIDASIL